LIGFLLAGIIGCAASGGKQAKRINVPPGLDSMTVVKSLEVAKTSFVSADREKGGTTGDRR